MGARIVAVAEAMAAMSSRRPYQEPSSDLEVLAELNRESGSQFDPQVVAAAHRAGPSIAAAAA